MNTGNLDAQMVNAQMAEPPSHEEAALETTQMGKDE